ncbi:MAG: redoxin domain-containing protein [Nocardioidaceae bacterium]|nr:redoxin domain-containing protein [Nocardioidaceae bacterium]
MVEVGDVAPDFDLTDQHGRQVRLSSRRGRSRVVVLFYPFAFTPVCSSELRAVRDDVGGLGAADVEVLAISCDSRFTLRHFSDELGSSHPLLSDFWPHGEVARRYGVFDEERGCATRGTFVLDLDGVVRWKIENGLPDARDQDAYLRALSDIGG